MTITSSSNPLKDSADIRLPMIAEPGVLVFFGVTGDLAQKKLLPAMYDLANRGLLPPGFAMVGFGRREWSHEQFAEYVLESVKAHARTGFNAEVWKELSQGLRFVSGSFSSDEAFESLGNVLTELDSERGTRGNRAYYLSIPPGFFEPVVEKLKAHDLIHNTADRWSRVVVEKPFGTNLETAQELNRIIDGAFPPESVFRIDHYLGKETVQNILAFRFANQMFEPMWNNNNISHVQITMAEDIGIGGRSGYYDGVGAARDVIQNHLLQLMALTAMEEPTSFDGEQIRAEKEKVLAAASVPRDYARSTARGQYGSGWLGGRKVAGYLDEEGIDPHSQTETYAAMRVDIQNRRWAGVPFYLRSAKRMPRRVTEVALIAKCAPHLPFSQSQTQELGNNAIVMRIQPDEGITIRFGAKIPATPMSIRDVNMNFSYGRSFTEASPDAYERLLLGVLRGDAPLLPQQREVDLSWELLDPVLNYWAELDVAPEIYSSGTWGPSEADRMLHHDGFAWRRP